MSRYDLSSWFNRGLRNGNKYMMVYCDTFDYDDYPVFFDHANDLHTYMDNARHAEMTRLMGVYDLSMDKESQIQEGRCMHIPVKCRRSARLEVQRLIVNTDLIN